MEDFGLLEEYYRQSGSQYLRRDILTFLNNYNGELDRARAWKLSPPPPGSRSIRENIKPKIIHSDDL